MDIAGLLVQKDIEQDHQQNEDDDKQVEGEDDGDQARHSENTPQQPGKLRGHLPDTALEHGEGGFILFIQQVGILHILIIPRHHPVAQVNPAFFLNF